MGDILEVGFPRATILQYRGFRKQFNNVVGFSLITDEDDDVVEYVW